MSNIWVGLTIDSLNAYCKHRDIYTIDQAAGQEFPIFQLGKKKAFPVVSFMLRLVQKIFIFYPFGITLHGV